MTYLATDTTFAYDAAGNRTSVIDGSGTCTYTTNNLNQYTAAGTASYQYDASGNMVHDHELRLRLRPGEPSDEGGQIRLFAGTDPCAGARFPAGLYDRRRRELVRHVLGLPLWQQFCHQRLSRREPVELAPDDGHWSRHLQLLVGNSGDSL